MSEELFETSANTPEVAAPEATETPATPDTGVQEPSVNPSEVAEPNTVQDPETNARYAEQRRKQELEQYRTQAELNQQHLDRVARLSGYENHNELLAAVEELEREQERQKYVQAGIDPDRFNELVSELPEIKEFRKMQSQYEETQRLQNEANELFEEFPELTPEGIPQEAWSLKEQKGISLLDAYLRTSYKHLSQQKEQEVIQKIQGNAAASPGSLSGGVVEHTTSVQNMPKGDFEALIRKVKNGEVRSL